ncbi:MAG: hypothetical protein NTX76_00330 [Alphaproteobacteria bacterium]|nr:hypothetical protein [Alphaproteobacteria bacterium]
MSPYNYLPTILLFAFCCGFTSSSYAASKPAYSTQSDAAYSSSSDNNRIKIAGACFESMRISEEDKFELESLRADQQKANTDLDPNLAEQIGGPMCLFGSIEMDKVETHFDALLRSGIKMPVSGSGLIKGIVDDEFLESLSQHPAIAKESIKSRKISRTLIRAYINRTCINNSAEERGDKIQLLTAMFDNWRSVLNDLDSVQTAYESTVTDSEKEEFGARRFESRVLGTILFSPEVFNIIQHTIFELTDGNVSYEYIGYTYNIMDGDDTYECALCLGIGKSKIVMPPMPKPQDQSLKVGNRGGKSNRGKR